MRRNIWRVILVAFATVAMITINGMAPWLSPTGKNVGQISDQFQSYFTPAGYVFSIWGLIYLALLAFSVYQALPSQRDNPLIARIDLLYVASCGFNAAWLVVWQREWFGLSLVMMLGLLTTLLAIYVRLDPFRHQASSQENWLVLRPFSLYLGWITIATVANVAIVLLWLGWQGGGISGPVWAAIMVSVALLIVLFAAVPRRDYTYMLVLAWAAIGIVVKSQGILLLQITAGVVTCVVVTAVAMMSFRSSPVPASASAS